MFVDDAYVCCSMLCMWSLFGESFEDCEIIPIVIIIRLLCVCVVVYVCGSVVMCL